MSPERFYHLLQLFKSDALTPDDWEELRSALKSGSFDDQMNRDFEDLVANTSTDPAWSNEIQTAIWAGIKKETKPKQVQFIPNLSYRMKWLVAASVLVAILSGTYLIFNQPTTTVQALAIQRDAFPGQNRAVLTLGNGSTITLDSAKNGQLAVQGNSNIIKTQNGKLVYQGVQAGSAEPTFNTLSTPRGGQFELTLPDGTEVWLNAASSITYPTAFNGKERKVSITGEAYFEVKHDSNHPFFVTAGNQEIEDIGTAFNVNAYPDETVTKTVLVQGIVAVNGTRLKPGQQAVVQENAVQISQADIKETLAWKNDQFRFDSSDLGSVVRQIGRWYDLDVEYDNRISNHFTGIISRQKNASEVLKMLELTGTVHFRIEGKKLIVMK